MIRHLPMHEVVERLGMERIEALLADGAWPGIAVWSDGEFIAVDGQTTEDQPGRQQ